MVEQDESNIIQETDADLVKRARYDTEAFGLLYERYYDREYRIAYNKTGNREGAKDIVARVFENALGFLCFPKDPSKEFQMRKNLLLFPGLIQSITMKLLTV